LKAKKCEIYTDVDGVYSSDPKVITKAKLLKKITYDEMIEAATSGAKVLHNRSISVAKKHNLKILVKNSGNNAYGSVVESKESLIKDKVETSNIQFISKIDNMTKISIIGEMIMQNKELLSIVFTKAKELNITIYMISFSELTLNILVETNNAIKLMNELSNILIPES
jgi:aspartokinase